VKTTNRHHRQIRKGKTKGIIFFFLSFRLDLGSYCWSLRILGLELSRGRENTLKTKNIRKLGFFSGGATTLGGQTAASE